MIAAMPLPFSSQTTSRAVARATNYGQSAAPLRPLPLPKSTGVDPATLHPAALLATAAATQSRVLAPSAGPLGLGGKVPGGAAPAPIVPLDAAPTAPTSAIVASTAAAPIDAGPVSAGQPANAPMATSGAEAPDVSTAHGTPILLYLAGAVVLAVGATLVLRQ